MIALWKKEGEGAEYSVKDDNVVLVIGIILAVYLVLLLIIKIVRLWVKFNQKLQYITEELQRAGDDEEYRYWRRELRCHYLRLLPFVNRYNVRRVYYVLYHRSERNKSNQRSDGIFHILAPSLIGIVVCALCMCGASWAWFTASTSADTAAIQAATYTVTVTAKLDQTEAKTETEEGVTTVTFADAGAYTVTLKPHADNTVTAGYCKVEFGDKTYYTDCLTEGKLTFTVNAAAKATLTVRPQWGSYSGDVSLENKDTIGKAVKTDNDTKTDQTEPTTKKAETTTEKREETTEKQETTTTKREEQPDTPTTTTQAEEVSENQ